MENDVGVRKLVELIFLKLDKNIAEMTAENSSIPACLQTRVFTRSMDIVLSIKRTIVIHRWLQFFDTCWCRMITSHEMYLRYIMFALQTEYKCHQNIFESFISVCAVLKNLSKETLLKTEMDFRELDSDIFMVFYQSEMRKIFHKSGGFQGLVEYILGHRYVAWNPNDIPLTTFDAYRDKKIADELHKERVYELIFNSDETANDATSVFLAKKVLSMTSFRFPTLLSKHDLVPKLVAYKRNQITLKAEAVRNFEASLNIKPLEKVSEGSSNSNLDSKTNHAAEQKEDIAEYDHICSNSDSKIEHTAEQKEEIVEYKSTSSHSDSQTNHTAEPKDNISEYEDFIDAVIRYNHSKSSGQEKANNRLQKEAYAILDHLKDHIKSFIEFLDVYDDE